MAEQQCSIPDHFVVFIPGIMGSKLRRQAAEKEENVWIDLFELVWANPFNISKRIGDLLNELSYPNDKLIPNGIVDKPVWVPPLGKNSPATEVPQLLQRLGYRDGSTPKTSDESEDEETLHRPYFLFSYDWRQDNRRSAENLRVAINNWRNQYPNRAVWIIAHSMGGLVARWYIEHLGGHQHVGKLILCGSPGLGAPKSLATLLTGLDAVIHPVFSKLTGLRSLSRKVIRTFPSLYQLIPVADSFLSDRANRGSIVDPFDQLSWLSGSQEKQHASDAKTFVHDLGSSVQTDSVSILGRGKKTPSYGSIEIDSGGNWKSPRWDQTGYGDGTVTISSASFPRTIRLYATNSEHGSMFANRQVQEILEYELTAKYPPPSRPSLALELVDDTYLPGQEIMPWVEARRNPPLSGASAWVTLSWIAPLPGGNEGSESGTGPSTVQLTEVGSAPGIYVDQNRELRAPERPGFYMVQAGCETSPDNVTDQWSDEHLQATMDEMIAVVPKEGLELLADE